MKKGASKKKAARKKKEGIDIGSSAVSLKTWGTHPDSGNGMTKFIDAAFFGKNVGHAALTLSFPADETGERLISDYCLKKNEHGQFELDSDCMAVIQIPFERYTQDVMKDKILTTQDYFSVYFSWWPLEGERNGHLLEKSPNEDNIAERPGSSAPPVSSRFKDDLEPSEERIYHGVLGSKKVILSTNEILHPRNLSDAQQAYLKLQFELSKILSQIQTLNRINEKLDRNPRITESLTKLLDKCGIDWKDKEIELIREDINQKLEELRDRKSDCSGIIQQQKRDLEKDYAEYLEAEVSQIKEMLSVVSEMQHDELIEQISERFSPQAWSRYELEKITTQKDIANQIQMICAIDINLNPVTVEDREHNINKIRLIQEVFFHPKDNIKREHHDPRRQSNINCFADWRKFLPKEYFDVTEDDFHVSVGDFDTREGNLKIERIKQIIDAIYQNALDERRSLIQPVKEAQIIYNSIKLISDPLEHLDNEHYVTRGHRHDQEVFLPVGGISEGENVKHGLNIEKMLSKMHALTEEEKGYNTFAKNCSTTVGAILAEGAEPELKSYFEDKVWGAFGTPQEVHNSALKYADAVLLNEGKKPTKDRIAEHNPLNAPGRLAGMALRKLLDPTTPTMAKVGLGVAIVPAGILAGTSEVIKSFGDPNDTFGKSRRLISYAATHDSTMLKMSIPVVALVTGLVAPLAGIQTAVKKVMADSREDHLSNEELSNLSKRDPHTAQENYVDDRRSRYKFKPSEDERNSNDNDEYIEIVSDTSKDEGIDILSDDDHDDEEGVLVVSDDEKAEEVEIVSNEKESGSRSGLFFSDYRHNSSFSSSQVPDKPDDSPSSSRTTKPRH